MSNLDELLNKVVAVKEVEKKKKEAEELLLKSKRAERSTRWEEMREDIIRFARYTKEIYEDEIVPIPCEFCFDASTDGTKKRRLLLCLKLSTITEKEKEEETPILITGSWNSTTKKMERFSGIEKVGYLSFYVAMDNPNTKNDLPFDLVVEYGASFCPITYRDMTNALMDLMDNWHEKYRKETEEYIEKEMQEYITLHRESMQPEETEYEQVRYDLELSYEDILLVEKYNGTARELFLDPLYLEVLKDYMRLLGKESANTLEISDADYIRNVLSANRGMTQETLIYLVSDPVKIIKEGINKVCDAVGLYSTYPKEKEEEVMTDENNNLPQEQDSTVPEEINEKWKSLENKYRRQQRLSYGSAILFAGLSVACYFMRKSMPEIAATVALMGAITSGLNLLSALMRKVRFERGDYY